MKHLRPSKAEADQFSKLDAQSIRCRTDGEPVPGLAAFENNVINIAHCSLNLSTGGLERLLADFARCHDRSRFRLEFVVLNEVGRFAEEIRSAGCVIHHVRERSRFRLLRRLKELFHDRRYDIVHTHNTFPHIYGSVAARWAGVPVLVHTRHGQRLGHDWKSRFQYRMVSHLVDRMVGVSHDASRLSLQQDRITAAKVLTIWNGIDVQRFFYSGPGNRKLGIAVGRLSEEKDYSTLLQAVALVVREIPEFRVQIVGDGPERGRLQKLQQELELTHAVTFLGDRADVTQLLAGAGFLISSSRSEGLSLTLLEAMAVGLPVIATEVGGNSEVVRDGVTGSLVAAGDPRQLADAIIERLRMDSHDLDIMGLCGRQRVVQHFDVSQMVENYQDLYQALIQSSCDNSKGQSFHLQRHKA